MDDCPRVIVVMDVEGKKLTVESDEESVFAGLVKKLEDILASSVTKNFRDTTLHDACVIILRAAVMPSSFHWGTQTHEYGHFPQAGGKAIGEYEFAFGDACREPDFVQACKKEV